MESVALWGCELLCPSLNQRWSTMTLGSLGVSLTAPPPLPAHHESMGILCSWTWWSLYSQEQQKGVWAYPLTEHKVKGKGLSSSRQPLGSIRPGLGVCHVEDCEWMSVQNPGKPHRPEALVPITCLVQDPQIHRDSHGSAALQCFVF